MSYRSKNTKIVATLSTATATVDYITKLYEGGLDVVRLNSAHQDINGAKNIIDSVRKVSENIAILLDTKGPEMRTCQLEEELVVSCGESVFLTGNLEFLSSQKKVVYINYSSFSQDIPQGSSILIDDGQIVLQAKYHEHDIVCCEVKEGGIIKNKKGVNVPDTSLHLPALSSRDKHFIAFAIKENIDFIAHSFVRNKGDVETIQTLLDAQNSKIKLIAKIENKEGVENLDEILDIAHGVMVARGDLGVEVPAYEVPLLQKNIIARCLRRGRPVIVATHMLESMIYQPRATRAEVSDVANAILDGASAVMLSGETAYGKYPVASVTMMSQISLSLKNRDSQYQLGIRPKENASVRYVLAQAAVNAALQMDAKAIIVPSFSGETARLVSSFQARKPIFAQCFDKTVMRQLALSHGIFPSYLPTFEEVDSLLVGSLHQLLKEKSLTLADTVVVVAGRPGHFANFLEVDTVKNMLSLRKNHLMPSSNNSYRF